MPSWRLRDLQGGLPRGDLALVVPSHEEDPDFDASKGWDQFDWFITVNRDATPISPAADATLADQGLTHKAVLGFSSKP